MMFNREYESISNEDLEQLQMERLQATLNRVYRNVAFYHRLFDENGVSIESIRSVKDLSRLPFTTREDLRRSYPYDMFAVPLRDIVRLHSTSGTTGKPIVAGYTRNDLAVWTSVVSRVLCAVGITAADFVQIAFNYNLMTGGFGFQYAAERLGASVIPSAGEDVSRQIMVMKDYRTTALVSTPGYALHIASVLEDEGIHPEKLALRVGIFGAEAWSEALRSRIEAKLRIEAYDNYGLSEIIGPGVAFECVERNGLHINEDHFIPEVIDPETLAPVPDGTAGELVLTTITKQGLPLVRYRTGDITSLDPSPCACGRTLRRMSRISGRTDDMIVIEGVNVFPSQIEKVLLEMEGIQPHYQLVIEREAGIDTLRIKVEASNTFSFVDDIMRLSRFQKNVEARILTELGLRTHVTLVEPKSLNRSTGSKLNRVVDRRDE